MPRIQVEKVPESSSLPGRKEEPETYCHAKIISDGTARGTKIEVDGKPLGYVQKIVWIADVNKSVATVFVKLVKIPVEIQGEIRRTAVHIVQPPAEKGVG